MATTLITIAQTALLVGTPLGPFVSLVLPANPVRYAVSLTGVVWPIGIDPQHPQGVLKVIADVARDGVTWKFDAMTIFTDKSNPTGKPWFVDGWGQDGVTTRKLRVTLQALQACTLIASVSS